LPFCFFAVVNRNWIVLLGIGVVSAYVYAQRRGPIQKVEATKITAVQPDIETGKAPSAVVELVVEKKQGEPVAVSVPGGQVVAASEDKRTVVGVVKPETVQPVTANLDKTALGVEVEFFPERIKELDSSYKAIQLETKIVVDGKPMPVSIDLAPVIRELPKPATKDFAEVKRAEPVYDQPYNASDYERMEGC